MSLLVQDKSFEKGNGVNQAVHVSPSPSSEENMVSEDSLGKSRSLFKLGDPLDDRAIRANSSGLDYKLLQNFKYGQVEELNGVPSVHQGLGRKLLDVVWISTVPLFHRRVVEILIKNSVTGWRSSPVLLTLSDGKVINDYHAVSILGRCDTIYLGKPHSSVTYKKYPRCISPMYRGLFVSKSGWDGSDLFMAADNKTGYVVITEKASSALINAKITNLEIISVDEVEGAARDLPDLPL